MAAIAKSPPVMLIPPPLLFVLTFLAGVLLQRRLPLPTYAGTPPLPARVLGFALLAFWFVLMSACMLLFLRARTTIIPQGSASALVTSGPYRISRNPMYVSLASAYLGVVVLTGNLWSVLLLAVPVAVLQRVVIPFEEGTMQATFGGEYEAYRAHVRRWL